ncbi:MAG TPA: hypothetical protein VHQ65_11580, partial [Thermoanaerobaculia bacterium]|nr:hypothetical protein [Thermoanaerobaculia bacterium]
MALPAGLWLAARPPRREVLVAGAALLVAVLALGARWQVGGAPSLDDPGWRAAVEADYRVLWRELEDDARRASRSLPETPRIVADPLVAFRALEDLLEEDRSGRASLLLLDPDGQPVAWAGEGLLHELQSPVWPFRGAAFEASFGAVTAFFVAPVGEGPRPWHAVAARSFATDQLPFGRQPEGGTGLHWSLARNAEQASRGAVVLAPAGASTMRPALVVGARAGGLRPRLSTGAVARLAWLALGFALLALAVMRGVGLALAAPAAARPGAAAPVFAVLL